MDEIAIYLANEMNPTIHSSGTVATFKRHGHPGISVQIRKARFGALLLKPAPRLLNRPRTPTKKPRIPLFRRH